MKLKFIKEIYDCKLQDEFDFLFYIRMIGYYISIGGVSNDDSIILYRDYSIFDILAFSNTNTYTTDQSTVRRFISNMVTQLQWGVHIITYPPHPRG